jgi:yecA family protein
MSTPDSLNPESSNTDLPGIEALADALRADGLAIDPSELHGSLCGYVSGGGQCDADDWLQRLALDADTAPVSGDALDRMRTATLAQFAAQDFGFELLLPDDDAPLADRAEALVGWCRGFLGGFGLAAPASDALSDEAAEALQDMGRIAASDLAYEESEADEDALAEIVEFVRVAALLLHGDCVLGAHRQRRLH